MDSSSKWQRVLYYFFPRLQFPSETVQEAWEFRDFKAFTLGARILFITAAVTYILHYYFIDVPLGLAKQSDFWFIYRFSVGGICLVALALTTLVPKVHRKIHKFLYILFINFILMLQTQSMNHYEGVSYLWTVLLCILSIALMRESFLVSLFVATVTLLIQSEFVPPGVKAGPLFWGANATIMILIFFREGMANDIASYLKDAELLNLQKKIAETQKEFAEQIQSFLPKQINQRIYSKMTVDRLSVVQAIDDVLKVRSVEIVAMFTDIRGYTLQSKSDKSFLLQSAIPNTKFLTSIVEEHNGIPRLIGDLIFSYFDNADIVLNVENSIKAALLMAEKNDELNSHLEPRQRIKRFILLDLGYANVGNVSTVGSCREVTALGTCVNRLSRIDAATKEPSIQAILGMSAVVVSNDFYIKYNEFFNSIPFIKVDLKKLDITIRDFSEETTLWVLPMAKAQSNGSHVSQEAA